MDNDWRLMINHDDLKGETLTEANFPGYWYDAKEARNEFYEIVWEQARRSAATMSRGIELLNDNQVHLFWSERCDFCMEKVTADMTCNGYFTRGHKRWICKKCFDDLGSNFDFIVCK